MSKIITRHELVKHASSYRDPQDRRRKVAYAVFSYYDEDGFEYRKSFTAPINTSEEEFYRIAPKTMKL